MHRGVVFFTYVVVCLFFAASATTADVLTLGSNAPTGSPLLANPGVVSGPFLVTVTNNVSQDDPADFLAGWQITLIVKPESGATGRLQFDIADSPPDYVLAGVAPGSNSTIFTTAGPNDSLLSSDGDASPPITGAQVPITAANLLQVTLLPSINASGTFGIFAMNGRGLTEWTSAGEDGEKEFVNAPFDGEMVRIGEVFVTPEPGTLAVCLVGVMGLVWRRPRAGIRRLR